MPTYMKYCTTPYTSCVTNFLMYVTNYDKVLFWKYDYQSSFNGYSFTDIVT